MECCLARFPGVPAGVLRPQVPGVQPPSARARLHLLLYVANWPAPRADAWRQLLRARAIENQAYVVGVNRVGADGNGVAHAGDSAAIDFLGRTLAEGGDAPGVLSVELTQPPLAAFREKFPAHLDADRFTLEL